MFHQSLGGTELQNETLNGLLCACDQDKCNNASYEDMMIDNVSFEDDVTESVVGYTSHSSANDVTTVESRAAKHPKSNRLIIIILTSYLVPCVAYYPLVVAKLHRACYFPS